MMDDYTDNFTHVPGEGSKLWHDMNRTIPALPGMTIAALEEYHDGKRWGVFVQPVEAKRPRAVVDLRTGRLAAKFGSGETTLWNVVWVRQNPLEGSTPWAS